MVSVLRSTKEYNGTSNPVRKKEKTVIIYTFYMSSKHFTTYVTYLLQFGNNMQRIGNLMLL